MLGSEPRSAMLPSLCVLVTVIYVVLWAELCLPEDELSPTCGTWERGLVWKQGLCRCNCVKVRSDGIGVGLTSSDSLCLEDQGSRGTDTGRCPVTMEAATSQAMPGTASNHHKPGGRQGTVSL